MGIVLRKACVVVCLTAGAASLATGAGAGDNADKLYSVLRGGDLRGLKSLLDQGISPDTPDRNQITPLMYAAQVGSLEAMRILLDHGADVNARNGSGSTALMWSAADPARVRLLLERGADVNKASKSGRTALMLAGFSPSSAEVVRMLLTPADRKSVV